MGILRWYFLAEWRMGPWRWIAMGVPLLLSGMLLLPDPVGGDEGPAGLAAGLLRWLTLVGWATSSARRDTELPRWTQRPWLPAIGTLGGVLMGAALLGVVGSLTLCAWGAPAAIPELLADHVPWLAQMAPWVVLLTLALGAAASPWAIVLLPFVASWLAPVLSTTPFAGWLPGQVIENFHPTDALRSLLVALGVIGIAASLGPRKPRATRPTRCL